MKCIELIEPRTPGNSEIAGAGRKYRWVSFANTGKEERGTSREEGGGRSEDTGGRKDEERLGRGRMEDERRKRRERRRAGSHSVHQPISAHSPHGSCPTGSATYGPRETQDSHSGILSNSGRPSHGPFPSGSSTYGTRVKFRMAPLRPFRHTLHMERAPLRVPRTAPLGGFVKRPPAYFDQNQARASLALRFCCGTFATDASAESPSPHSNSLRVSKTITKSVPRLFPERRRDV